MDMEAVSCIYAKIELMQSLPPVPDEHHTFRRHRRQFLWQILLPVVMASVLILVAAVFTGRSNTGQVRLWADISIVWLLIPLMLLGVFVFILLAGLIYLLSRLLKATPKHASRIQKFFWQVNQEARRATNLIIKPVMMLKRVAALLKSIFKR